METTEILDILQLLHAGDRIDAIARFASRGLLQEITAASRLEEMLAAPARVRQFGLTTAEDVFHFQSHVFGHTLWQCTREGEGIIAQTRTCKLCDIARARRTAQPCAYCCLDPLTALCAALPVPVSLNATSTLWSTELCRIHLVPLHSHMSKDQR